MKKIFIFTSILFLISSCNDDINNGSDSNSIFQNDVVVLKERDSNSPWVSSDYKSKFANTNAPLLKSSISTNDFLGYSFRDRVYPFEDTRNLGHPVIDVKKLDQINSSYVDSWRNSTGDAYYYSYSSFDRYNSKSTITQKVNGGFNLNLGLFSVGSKNTYSSVFTKTLVEDAKTTFGELNIVVRDSCYRIQVSSNIKNIIKENCLLDVFKSELYNTHPSELFYNYGGFVLSNYIVGGKATALYAGVYKKTETSEIKEKKLDSEINASYGFNYSQDASGKVSGNLGFGRANSNNVSITNEFTSINMAIKTLGGNSSFAAFSAPKEINNTNIDLSNWLSSLSDKNNHSIIEFGFDGLVPISDFIVEENLKSQIKKYYATGVTTLQQLQEPYISIEVVLFCPPAMYALGTSLHTRFGDEIMLRVANIGPEMAEKGMNYRNEYLRDEVERVTAMFGVKVLSGLLQKRAIEIRPDLLMTDSYNEGSLKKVIHKGTVYIVNQSEKLALSIHNDQFIDEYAMRELINRLPIIDMDFKELLRDYVINAL